MRRFLTLIPLCAAISGPACTNDLRAPTNYLTASAGGDATAGGALTVTCGALDQAAVGAELVPKQVMASGGAGGLRFEFADVDTVPAGLSIDPESGVIIGIPETEGDNLEFVVRVTDVGVSAGEDTCILDVNPQLAVPLRVDAPGCLSGNESLRDVVLPGTGDGTPITCTAPGGRGNGTLPDGMSVDAQSCRLEGTSQDERFGTWVAMMRGEQSGAEVWVPFCVTNDDPGNAYNVRVSTAGDDDATFDPMLGVFDPDADFSIGAPGTPHFEVDDAEACGNNGSCSFGFNYAATSSHFNTTDINNLVINDELLRNDAGTPIGMQHDLERLMGDNLAEGFRNRPWTMNISLDYCLTEEPADCDGAALQRNAGARFQYSFLLFPDPA